MHTYPLQICFVPALISDLRSVLFHSKGNEKRYLQIYLQGFCKYIFSAFIYAVFCQFWLPVSLPLDSIKSISVMEIWKSGPHLHHLLCFSPFLSRPSPICLITQSHMDAQYVVLIRLQGVTTHRGHEGLQQLQIWEKESSSQHKLGELQPGWVECVRCTKIFL